MKKLPMRDRLVWGAGAIAALGVFYALSRHDALGLWHGMIQWPRNMFIISIIIAAVAAAFSYREVVACSVVGYITGFLAAMLLSSDYSGPGDPHNVMSYNNAWLIWTVSYLIIIIAGLMWTTVAKHRHKKT